MADPIELGDEVAIKPAQRKDLEKVYHDLPDAFIVEFIDDTRPRRTLVLIENTDQRRILAYASDCTRVRTKAQREQGKAKVQKDCQTCSGIGLAGLSGCLVCQGKGKVWVTEG